MRAWELSSSHVGAVAAQPGCAGASFALSLLRGFELRGEDRPLTVPRSAQRVVAFLGLNPGRLSRTFVAGQLWTDANEQRAAAALRTALWRLGGFAAELVRCDGQTLSLHPAVELDVARCSRLAHDMLDSKPGTWTHADLSELRDAGELLPDWYDDWVLIERERFRLMRAHALERLCRDLSSSGRHADATEAGIAAVATDPLRESAHRALIEAHLAQGNSSDALRQYDLCKRLLRRDLDLPPSRALEELTAHVRGNGRARRVTKA